ncbi:hypothetical protein WR25_20509 [Diploscapter pachys]|uniref:Glycoside hydrolase family 19 catalytic domain-containing protein n=1 Tax=Diploscapter pachys TaxID=2018661 RepID=A0A2A2LSF1_9BILA|nr:hypothetical protein WR25_20509 [Diploscapter pachys]
MSKIKIVITILYHAITILGIPDYCPKPISRAKEPSEHCAEASDPNELPKSGIEKWFTKEMFEDLFPHANLGYGPHACMPYSYEAFIIAARYFPEFGAESPSKVYEPEEHHRRDVSAFFAHAIQETGENNLDLYNNTDFTVDMASECFYRGGFYNWFERGPNSSFLHPSFPGYNPVDGKRCIEDGKYCKHETVLDMWYPCNETTELHANVTFYRGCYFGRGALQLSWNYNYGLFQQFLLSKKIEVDLLANPNLVITKMDPPLAMLASLWFYMTPQPPKPSMHSIVVGESRRIKAFKWFTKYFNVTAGPERTLSCKGMLEGFEAVQHMYSWHPDWGNMWRSRPCDCEPAPYGGES